MLNLLDFRILPVDRTGAEARRTINGHGNLLCPFAGEPFSEDLYGCLKKLRGNNCFFGGGDSFLLDQLHNWYKARHALYARHSLSGLRREEAKTAWSITQGF